jgi:hypothetical protein
MFSAFVAEGIDDPTVGLCGEITMRWEEWDALEDAIQEPIESLGIRISMARP